MLGIVFIISIVAIFMLVTVMNGRTEIPEECRDIEIDKCSSCHSQSCNIKKEVIR